MRCSACTLLVLAVSATAFRPNVPLSHVALTVHRANGDASEVNDLDEAASWTRNESPFAKWMRPKGTTNADPVAETADDLSQPSHLCGEAKAAAAHPWHWRRHHSGMMQAPPAPVSMRRLPDVARYIEEAAAGNDTWERKKRQSSPFAQWTRPKDPERQPASLYLRGDEDALMMAVTSENEAAAYLSALRRQTELGSADSPWSANAVKALKAAETEAAASDDRLRRAFDFESERMAAVQPEATKAAEGTEAATGDNEVEGVMAVASEAEATAATAITKASSAARKRYLSALRRQTGLDSADFPYTPRIFK